MSQASLPFNSASASWEEHRTVFFQALKTSDRPVLEAVLKKYPEAVDWKDAKGCPPLHTAFAKRDLDTFKFLLEKGADPNQYEQLTGLRVFFNRYGFDDPGILEKAVKHGEKDYIIPLLQHNAEQTYRTRSEKAPKEIRFEIEDLLKRGDKIRKEFLASTPAPAPAAAPAIQPPASAAEIQLMKPAQVQRRAPNASA